MLDWCQKVAEYKRMPLIQLVADKAVYKYIEEYLCEDESRWPLVKDVLGGFHIEMFYIHAIGKKMTGSGIEELAVAAGVIAAGSVKHALSGKHYNRAMRLHKIIADALLQMLIKKCAENHPEFFKGLEHVLDITTENVSEEFAA